MNLGGNIDLLEIDFLTYDLLTIFTSSKEITKLEYEKFGPLIEIKDRFETSKASKTLITLAIITRNILDAKTDNKKSNELFCGELNENGIIIKLNIREACNKIVHAQHIDFEEITENQYSHLSAIINLFGERQNKEWTAKFDVYEFCLCLKKVI